MRFWCVLVLLGCVGIAQAADVVCGDATHLTRYIQSVDPSKAPNDPLCSVIGLDTTAVGDAEVASQRAILANNPFRYLKKVNGLAVVMTQPEKDAVDLALSNAAAARQEFADELTSQDVCSSPTLLEIANKIDAFYDSSAATMTAAISPITNGNGAANITAIKQALITVAQELSQQRIAVKKLARCVLATRKAR